MEGLIVGVIAVAVLVVIGLVVRAQGAMKYSYTNAKTRGMVAKLMPPQKMEEYCEYGVSEIVTDLESAEGYKDLVRMIGDDFSVENIQLALNKKSESMSAKVVGAVPKNDRRFFAHLAARLDYQNVKVLARLKQAGKFGAQYTRLVTPTKTFEEHKIEDFLSCSLDELWTKLRFTRFKKVVDEFQKGQGVFEQLLDREYFSKLLSLAKETKNSHVVRYARKLIDLHNISSLNSFAEEGEIIAGGVLPRSTVWAAKEDAQSALADTYVQGGVKTLQDARFALERDVHESGRFLLTKDPMTLNSALGYYILKEMQVTNLKRILKLKASGVPVETVRGVVV